MKAKSKPIRNEMIRASAGSGKTYQLVNRYIRLLLCDQEPGRIIALTFTRKAAGEFLEGILTKLAKASADDVEAAKLACELDIPSVSRADFTRVLRKLLDRMPHLSLGTIDGFFHRVLGLFSLEYGLSGEFDIMDEFSAERAKASAMEQLFSATSVRKADREALAKSFELVSGAKQDRRFYETFENYLSECHNLYHRVPSAEYWGQPETIWSERFLWEDSRTDKLNLAGAFRDALEAQSNFDKRLSSAWLKVANHLDQWEIGENLLAEGGKLLEMAFAELPQLQAGAWSFMYYGKKFKPEPAFSQALAELLQHCLSAEIQVHLKRTRGVYGMLKAYDTCYDKLIRRQGLLTFADLPMLLAPRVGQPVLGGQGPEQLLLEYRLDGSFDHWLFDEFQDTSSMQWKVVENLIDEIVQDPEGRTFFCVGDVKQSIYSWRGGDPKLFGRVQRAYCAGDVKEFALTKLNVCWRSAPAVIKMINAVFGSRELLTEFNKDAASHWEKVWETHVVPKEHQEMVGHAMHLTVADKEERYPVLAELLRKLKPTERGLNCAILVRTNKEVAGVVNYLRANVKGMTVAGESATRPATDNAAGIALLSLVKASAHPGDTFAKEHVLMTPIGNALSPSPEEWAAHMRQVQRQFYQKGYEVTLRDWAQTLKTDSFSEWRIEQLLEIARQFDELGLRDADEFIEFAKSRDLNELAGSGVIQVMTVHKAKGLTFDVTLLPDLEGDRLDSRRRESMYASENDEGGVDWVMDLPKQDLCAADAELGKAIETGRTEACFEAICWLYVALTRARHAVYLISTEPREKNPSLNYPYLLNRSLGNADGKWNRGKIKATKAYERVGADGIGQLDKKSSNCSVYKKRAKAKAARFFPRLERRKPSEHDGVAICSTSLFELTTNRATEFGTAVHAMFERIYWWDEAARSKLELLRCESQEAVKAVERCFEEKEIVNHFTEDPNTKVWRERAFGVILDNEFCSGVFDRVLLWPDHAEIVDFKTDRFQNNIDLENAVERHRPQLEWYRKVLMKLTDLPAKKIKCMLLFTHIPKLVEVGPQKNPAISEA